MASSASRRVKAITVLQYEATECGAASLATILRYYGRIVPLPQLRRECGVNRDGSNAQRVLLAARNYGLETKAFRCSGEQLIVQGQFPCVVFWGSTNPKRQLSAQSTACSTLSRAGAIINLLVAVATSHGRDGSTHW